jgi:hypothetical protein
MLVVAIIRESGDLRAGILHIPTAGGGHGGGGCRRTFRRVVPNRGGKEDDNENEGDPRREVQVPFGKTIRKRKYIRFRINGEATITRRAYL